MAEIAKDTDLSKLEGAPNPERALVRFERESCEVEAKMPAWLGGASVRVASKTLAYSPLAAALATFLLLVSGCLAAAVPLATNAPAWATVTTALGAPAAIYLLIRATSRQRTK
jgi:hypothetical protein